MVNPISNTSCGRCGTALATDTDVDIETAISPTQSKSEPIRKRRAVLRIGWIAGTTLSLLFAAYLSLLLTSEDLPLDQRQTVTAAIGVLEQKGFNRQAFVLRHLVRYRATDNWWNNYLGHHAAYAATNFPFEVVTLYPDFFDVAVDDTERASILLHESHHLFGSGEDAALSQVWHEKQQLGWTIEKYGMTKVWANTRDLTAAAVPTLFTCGSDGHSDCTQDVEVR